MAKRRVIDHVYQQFVSASQIVNMLINIAFIGGDENHVFMSKVAIFELAFNQRYFLVYCELLDRIAKPRRDYGNGSRRLHNKL